MDSYSTVAAVYHALKIVNYVLVEYVRVLAHPTAKHVQEEFVLNAYPASTSAQEDAVYAHQDVLLVNALVFVTHAFLASS